VRDALASGVSRNRLDARDVVRIHHGARTTVRASGLRESCAALVPLLSEGQAFTGPTAARLGGLPLPMRWERDDRLHVSSLRPQRAMRRPGVVGSARGSGSVVEREGLPVLEPEVVWIALARSLGVDDLIAVGDRLVSGTLRTPPVSTIDGLAAAVASSRGIPGAARARSALAMVRVGAWSRPETFVRLLLHDAGVPEPELNVPIVLSDRIVIPDLSWPRRRVAVEYDGWWHVEQGDRDADRHERLSDAGWIVVHVRRHDLFHRPAIIVDRVVRRLSECGYRHPQPVDVTRLRRFVA